MLTPKRLSSGGTVACAAVAACGSSASAGVQALADKEGT
jgi:hypothetical protein